MSDPPALSFCTCGRNDNYMGNPLWRMHCSIMSIADSMRWFGLEAEIVVTDWGSEEPLGPLLALPQWVNDMVRYIYVCPDTVAEVSGDSEFYVSMAYNVAVRRATGQYIALMDADHLIIPPVMAVILKALAGKLVEWTPPDKTFWYTSRLNWVNPFHSETEEVDIGYRLMRAHCLSSPLCQYADEVDTKVFAPTGMALMHRDLWHEVRGYNETARYMEFIDADLGIRVCHKYVPVRLDDYGATLLHIEHYTGKREQGRQRNERALFNGLTHNDENWGMADRDLKTYKVDGGREE